MGVSGSGKSTVGRLLAGALSAAFLDGDDFHTLANKEKMRAGIPLSDDDRWQWLGSLGREARARLAGSAPIVVIACSALKRRYRNHIAQAANEPLLFIFLDGHEEVIADRLKRRRHEFMNRALLSSQLATLERPGVDENVVVFLVDKSPDEIARDAAHLILHLNSTMV